MKTIAITIDPRTHELLDQMARRRPAGSRSRSRSAIVREAVRELATREERRVREAREAEILHRNREKLRRQVQALIDAQARS